MAGLGLSLGLGLCSRRGGSASPPASTSIAPGGTWDGTAESGYGGSPPTDPPRTTAKPIVQPLFVPNQTLTADTVLCVSCEAFGGVQKVQIACEGNTLDLTSKTWSRFTDVNGTTKSTYGYHFTLGVAAARAAQSSGSLNLYITGIANDGTMQNKVVGPLLFHVAPSQYAGTRTIGTSGADHTTLKAALDWIQTNAPSSRNYQVQAITDMTLDLSGSVTTTYNGATRWVTIEAASGKTLTLGAGATRTSIRLKYDGLRFKGSNVQLDQGLFSTIFTEVAGNQMVWLDGVTLKETGGRNATFDGIAPQSDWISRVSGGAQQYYYTDCVGDDIYRGPANATLVRGCRFTNIASDAIYSNQCLFDTSIDGLDPASGTLAFRVHQDCATWTYGGAGVPSIEVTNGINVTFGQTRIMTVKVDGVAVGASLTLTNPNYSATGSGFTTWSDIVAFINTKANFSASLLQSRGRAVNVCKRDIATPINPMTGTDASVLIAGVGTLTAFFDVHADGTQYAGTFINTFARFVSIKGMGDAQGLYLDKSSTSFTDCYFGNYEVQCSGGSSNSQLLSFHKHVIIEKCSIGGQGLQLRADGALGGAPDKYTPDAYCAIRLNSFQSFAYSGTPNNSLVTIDNNAIETGTQPSGATNGITSSTPYVNFAGSDLTPSVGGGLTRSGYTIGARLSNGDWNI